MITAKISIFRAAVMVALFCVSAVFICQTTSLCAQQKAPLDTLIVETADGPQAFTIEIATTPAQKSRGLMFRTSLKPGHAMLFPHDEPKTLSMWMRNTYIPLDMVFIAADGRVFRVEERAQPHSETIISSNGAVTAVLEIGGGEAARLKIRKGDLVRHAHFGTIKQDN